MTTGNHWEKPFAMGLVLAFAGAVAAVRLVAAQDANSRKDAASISAPVPENLKSAKRVFIGNAGVDGTSFETFAKAGDASQPYGVFYAAMKKWGHYELVGSPADADLVMEIRFAAPMTDCGKLTSYKPAMELAVLDAKTHFQVWAITAPVKGAFRKSAWNKNIQTGAAVLVDGLKKISGDAGATRGAGN